VTDTPYLLAESVALTPHVVGWPAWWGNVAPGAAAFVVAHQQLRLLKSYLRDPAMHLRAAAMNASGAAFLDAPVERAADVAELAATCEREYGDSIALANDLAAFMTRLLTEARGQSLEPFYRELPGSLRGYVELVYDYYNRASIRLDEGMLYRSAHHKPHLQQLAFQPVARDADRPFFLSGLRLPGGAPTWTVPFGDPRVKALAALDVNPRPLGYIRELLGDAWSDAIAACFVPGAPRSAPPAGNELRIKYFGHACVLVEHEGRSALVDPFIGPKPSSADAAPRYGFGDLPERIDYAVITHAHPDHFDLETLIRILPRVGELLVPKNMGLLVGDVSLAMLARSIGFTNVREVGSFEGVPFGEGEILAVPFFGEHGDVAHINKAGWVVRAAGQQILFAADSTAHDIELYRRLRGALGDIDTVFMNTEAKGSPLSWTYDALFPRVRDRRIEADRRCRGSNAEEGTAVVQTLGARRVYNYALGLEPWVARIVGPSSGPSEESDRLLRNVGALGGVAVTRLQGPSTFTLS